ncbi:hypothetical protein [Pseudonocardia sp. TRM90224]|uniref:hypothetical protein n=1 Tax=Pseudonocardia sp. TRM90224 TaxID=2812678 RepID=UPI001E453FE5|nr:hypothetical protein [Pseudonocardia sp. TRM90224]
MLRRVELASRDAYATLRAAIGARSFDTATNTTNVIHSRITRGNTVRLDPAGERHHDWVPADVGQQWNTYLTALADTADQRTAELGRSTADTSAAWATDALGPVPAAGTDERTVWERNAATIAGYRELRDHTDPHDALGPAPKAGQVEAYAAYRAAWRALDRPAVEQAEHELTRGALRARVTAWERELQWGPRYVGNELAGTLQAISTHTATAAIRRAEATNATTDQQRATLLRQASESDALVAVLDEQADKLRQVDDARAEFMARTALTRAEAEAARYLLAEQAGDHDTDEHVTGQEWLHAEHVARREDDPH